jgi:hypothetical protein
VIVAVTFAPMSPFTKVGRSIHPAEMAFAHVGSLLQCIMGKFKGRRSGIVIER